MGVAPAREGDRDAVIATVVAAFAEDPVERWLYPGDERYLEHFPAFVAAFGVSRRPTRGPSPSTSDTASR